MVECGLEEFVICVCEFLAHVLNVGIGNTYQYLELIDGGYASLGLIFVFIDCDWNGIIQAIRFASKTHSL